MRAHDERFDGMINRLGLGEDVGDHLEIVGVGGRDEADATTAVIDDIKPKPKRTVKTMEIKVTMAVTMAATMAATMKRNS